MKNLAKFVRKFDFAFYFEAKLEIWCIRLAAHTYICILHLAVSRASM